jgi:diguanylate cyclase (GGDEF)-like protein/PAS domain S-box-containing protein
MAGHEEKMIPPTRVLIVEDSLDDAEMDVHLLRSDGFDIEWRRIESEPAYIEALAWPPQIILSDCSMPHFSALRALELLRAHGTDIPFIVVSGTVGEDTAVSLMKAGAQDYVLKTNLARLTQAVKRELREADIRRAERETRTSLQESEVRYRRIVETAEEGIWMIDADSRTTFANGKMAEMLGTSVEEMAGRSLFDFMEETDRQVAQRNIERRRRGIREQHDFRFRRLDGSHIWTMLSTSPVLDQNHQYRGALAMVTDITQRKAAEDAVRRQEHLLQLILDTEPECVKLLDADGRIVQMNAAGLAMLEADSIEQVMGKSSLSFIKPEYREPFQSLTREVLQGGSGTLEFEVIGLKGTRRWLETHAVPLTTSRGRMVLGVTRDITARKHAEQQLDYLAHHDALTALPNRTLFLDRLQQAIIDAERRGRHVGVVTLDIVRFKTINDSLGRESGDALLRSVAERLSAATRKGDTTARLGADEFALVMADMASANDMSRVSQKILEAFGRPFRLDGQEIHLSAVMGIALCPGDERSAAGLMRAAEIARHRTKKQDSTPYQFYSHDMSEHAEEILRLEHDLRRALDRQEFRLHYQPVVDARTRRAIGIEALVRWHHPERGMISPMQFIPLAEETGLIVPIGTWVLREACRQARAWHASGWRHLDMAVNVSAVQFARADFADTVRAALVESRLKPRSLVLELTESTLMRASEEGYEKLAVLRGLGVSLALDDFGTGYSSFAYLKRLPIDTLKIDRAFINDIPLADDSNAIADAMIKMAHSLDKHVVAEGVETEAQFMFLKSHGADAIQGYLLGAPMDAERLGQWLAGHSGK